MALLKRRPKVGPGRMKVLREETIEPVLDDQPKSLPQGERVRVRRGEIVQMDDVTKGERTASGVVGRIDGSPYVAVGGPNKGSVIQPIREEGTGAVLGIPTQRLERTCRVETRMFGYSNISDEAWERAFGKKHKKKE